ncbi:choline transporter [Tsukamurella pulmonis]|uniref:BCCT family transporter n=1 Tax=Tsukamurella pulmonis TaxID=47312 RepID=UPI000E09796F|nr:BCCT family transporter [Tsukamurella pulmonis]RDH11034.1 BCCT family transporter [Tsukamurella pulmonis]BDD84754.1 choline transporter [Tsukamurella pulmonis]
MATTESETKTRNQVDPIVFGVAGASVLAFIVWGFVAPGNLSSVASNILNWILVDLGWLFLLAALGFVAFAAYLALSKYGKIPLGRDGEAPEFRTSSWIAMMFAAGMGIGLVFYGAAEPIAHFVDAPPGMSAKDVSIAMATTMFHWGFHPWAIYSVVGLAVAYSCYRCGRSQLMSSVFAPVFNKTGGAGVAGRAIDILAIFATLFGTTASLGLGASQVGAGLKKLGIVEDGSARMVLVAIIAVLTALFVASAVSGVAKGIQLLSNINMIVALVLAVFVFVVGPTVFILNVMPTTLGAYLSDFLAMSSRTAANNPGSEDWLGTWTIFYWAWWVSWTPFVGVFLAKISKGRTIREFVTGVMLVPTSVSLVWFAIFGGTALHAEQTNPGSVSGAGSSEDVLFATLDSLWLPGVATVIVCILIGVFFITSADSASVVLGTLSERGSQEPSKWVTVFWGVLIGAVAALLLWAGGDGTSALNGIKTMAIIAALPFLIIMIGMCFSLLLDLRNDPLVQAHNYRYDQLDSRVRVHANTIAVTDDTEVLPSEELQVYSDGQVPEDLYYPELTTELVEVDVFVDENGDANAGGTPVKEPRES